MRIIAGEWRGRPVAAPEGQATRPTSDRARETLFSMLVSRLGDFTGLVVLDAFAGSGALGLEALSRGAAQAVFVETDRAAQTVIRANIATFGAGDRATVLAIDSTRPLPTGAPFDLLLLDPPYTAPEAPAAALAAASARTAPGAWASVETAIGATVVAPGWETDAVRKVGKAQLTILRRV
jgi:16S rRNA (guanine966-N2)-methyltransferase